MENCIVELVCWARQRMKDLQGRFGAPVCLFVYVCDEEVCIERFKNEQTQKEWFKQIRMGYRSIDEATQLSVYSLGTSVMLVQTCGGGTKSRDVRWTKKMRLGGLQSVRPRDFIMKGDLESRCDVMSDADLFRTRQES